MILTRLTGGLGNQMFQYSIARNYQRKKSERIILDTRLLQKLETDIEKILWRPYALDVFKKLKAQPLDSNLYNLLTRNDPYNKVRRKIFRLNTSYVVQQLMEPVAYSKINSRNIVLEGNYQSELYFKSIRQQLIEEFTFPDLNQVNQKIKERILNTSNSVSLHIRRGDYLSTLNKNIFTSVNLEYYQNAICYLLAKLGIPRLNTFVFTDDIAWVKENLKLENLNLFFTEGNYGDKSWMDMHLMSCCEHHIIANSSFSWWGAWLSQREGTNLAPIHWYRPGTYAFDIYNIIPASWHVIDYRL